MVPVVPMVPGRRRVLLRSLPALPRLAQQLVPTRRSLNRCGFSRQVAVAAGASDCVDRNNCVRFLVVFSFCF
jgi:hypothetical protein